MKIRKENFGSIIQVSKDLRIEYYNSPEGSLSAPITISLELTSDCPLNCNYCYCKRKSKQMTSEKITHILSQLEDAGIFEIHIGGGEPLLRKDLFKILSECKNKFITSLSTSGYNLGLKEARKLAMLTDQVNINFNSPFAKIAINNLIEAGANTGINILINKSNLSHLREYLKSFKELDISGVYILGPKPTPKTISWYKENKLEKADLIILKNIIEEYIYDFKIFVDCSLIELMSELPFYLKTFYGLFGCQAGIRRLFISSDGKVYPCSFLTEENDEIGDLLTHDFKSICYKNPFLKNFNKIFCPSICIGRYNQIKDNSSYLSGKLSLKIAMSSEHSAADYLFYSIQKIEPKERKKIKRLIEKHIRECDIINDETVFVSEHFVDHQSWAMFEDEFSRLLFDKFFDIGFSYSQLSAGTTLRISIPWDKTLYEILEEYEGLGDDGSILIRGKNKIIIELDLYLTHNNLPYREIVEDILIPVRENILKKVDFSPLQAFVDFYEIPCKNKGRKEDYSSLARRFRRTFSKGEEGKIPVFLFDKVVVQVSRYSPRQECEANLVFDGNDTLKKELEKFSNKSVYLSTINDNLRVCIYFKLKSDVKMDEDELEELFKRVRKEILEGEFSSLEYIYNFYNKLDIKSIKMTETTKILKDILELFPEERKIVF